MCIRDRNEEAIEDHQMHSEWYSVSEETARLINETRAAGHRVIAVGTISIMRVLSGRWKFVIRPSMACSSMPG